MLAKFWFEELTVWQLSRKNIKKKIVQRKDKICIDVLGILLLT
jgi:hypothetical protein